MSCTGCGGSSCRGCNDIKIVLPEGVGVESITDNGDGTWTITYTDNSTQVINTPGSVPNDAWVSLDETDMITINYTGTATYSLPSHGIAEIDIEYKILNEDTIVVKGQLKRTVDVTALDNSINCNFSFAPFGSSNWFAGTKKFVPTIQRVPIAIYTTTPVASPINPTGCIIASTSGANNLISLGETNLQLPNGTYVFYVHFEFTCELV